MNRTPLLAALLLVAGLLAALAAACSPGGNGFTNVDYCPDAGCPACRSDGDCRVIVDCCGTNWCTHVQAGHGVCKSLCPQLSEPPPDVRCRASRCTCG